jgi:serine/threonine-protein kinase
VNTAQTLDPLVGCVLDGRYRIAGRIARGGMSTVYSAVDLRLDRRVAVKVMSGALSADPSFTDRFAREARSAARMAHLNAVSVYDHGMEEAPSGPVVYLVMELVTGRTLRDLLLERGRLTPAEAVSLMEPVLAALAVAHRAGLVHRDIKPENILLSDDGVVKVADFGLARAAETKVNATQTGLMMGTVAYCSPEQVSRAATDQRSDVYSAGVVLFELLTGRPPFVGDSAMAVAYQHVHSRVPAPSSCVPTLPKPLDDLVGRATANEPAGRPANAAEFLTELHRVRATLRLPVMPVPRRPPPNGVGYPTGLSTYDLNRPTEPVRGSERRSFQTVTEPPHRPTRAANTGQWNGPSAARVRRRRRVLISWILLLLLGIVCGYAGWWFTSGRYTHVPNIAGESRTTALRALRNAGFTHVTTRTEFSEAIAKDDAIRTDPRAGARALPHTKISLVLSAGKERFAVPDVRNRSQAAATAALAGIPIKITTARQANDTVAKDLVIGTDPGAGTQVTRGATVRLLISSGPPVLTVPDVTNESQDEATKILSDTGFNVTATHQDNDSVPAGRVISQDPHGGTALTKFSQVAIVVSSGPRFVDMPGIVGLPSEIAQARLEQAGFAVSVKRRFGGLLGVTIGVRARDQDRNEQGQVRYGSTITIEVA